MELQRLLLHKGIRIFCLRTGAVDLSGIPAYELADDEEAP